MSSSIDKRPGFFRAAGTVSAAVFSSRITGMVREILMARLFGAGAQYDAFLAATRIPNLVRNLFAEGALSTAFVPVFTETLTQGGKESARRLSDLVATAMALVVGLVCLAGMAFSRQLMELMAPGFHQTPGKFELAVLMLQIVFPFLWLVSLSAQAMGVLNSCGRFGVPATASTFFNIGSLVFGIGFGFTVGKALGIPLIVSMAYGVIAGGVLQLVWQWPSLRRAGFGYRPRIDWRDPRLRRVAVLAVPAVLSTAAFQVNALVNTNFASQLKDASGNVLDGALSWLGYAFRFLQLPVGVFGAAIASATLPEISRSAATGRMDEFRSALVRSMGLALLVTVPCSAGLAVLAQSIVGVVYEWGRFRPYDTEQTAAALAAYSVGLAGYAVVKILAPAFFALGDGRTPVIVSMASMFVNLAAAITLVDVLHMGHVGLALATSIVALFEGATLFWILRGRLGGLEGTHLVGEAMRIVISAAAMSGVCFALNAAVHGWLGAGKYGQFASVAFSIPVGIAIFFVAARALGVHELKALQAACYTALKHASRPEAGTPPTGNR